MQMVAISNVLFLFRFHLFKKWEAKLIMLTLKEKKPKSFFFF